MFCPNCGTQLEDGALFCGSCGAKIAAPAQTAATSSAASVPAAPGRPLVSFKIGNMDFSIVKENIYFSGLIAAVVAFIALFLPYLTCKVDFLGEKAKQSVNFFSGTTSNAVFITLVLLVYIAANLFGKKLFARITSYVALAFFIITLIGIKSDISDVLGGFEYFSDAIKVYPSIGFYIELIAMIVMSFGSLIKSKLLPLIIKK